MRTFTDKAIPAFISNQYCIILFNTSARIKHDVINITESYWETGYLCMLVLVTQIDQNT